MTIRDILERDQPDWVRLRESLWPGSLAEHEAETRVFFADKLTTPIVFVAEVDGRVVGFLELDFRKYAPGCVSSPVAFIEGWHVEAAYQHRGIGRALVEAAETRARAMGHREIASDADLDNVDGIAAHLALGYEEVERAVFFRRALGDARDTRVIDLLGRDVVATLGPEHLAVMRSMARHSLQFGDAPDRYVERVVGDVQQYIHDCRIDTTWPACPVHPNHPMWFQDGWWVSDGVHRAKLGELTMLAKSADPHPRHP